MRSGTRVFCVFAACLLTLPSAATIIHVPGDQPTIQAGIDAAEDGDTVIVADGTYTGSGNRDIDFLGKAITVKSENGAESCIIDCEGSESDPHRGFNFHSVEGSDSVLEGFTVTNGHEPINGGGIYCDQASPTIQNCTIQNCTVFHSVLSPNGGGGICIRSADPTIRNCKIRGNKAIGELNVFVHGGGICCFVGSPTIIGNTITENYTFSWLVDSGGGIYCEDGSPLIINNTIDNNEAGIGSGLDVYEATVLLVDNTITGNGNVGVGGGVACLSSTVDADKCIITENESGQGGGLHLTNSEMTITNSLIAGNIAVAIGGGIESLSSNITTVNCTIYGNTADTGGGICSYDGSTLTVTSSILWANKAPSGHQIYFEGDDPTVTYSDIQGGWQGEGNIDEDPHFATGPFGDFYLSQFAAGQTEESLCVDGGDPASDMIEGTTRTDRVQDTGVVDIGYHFSLSVPCLVVGPGPASENPPTVRVFLPERGSSPYCEFPAYGPQHYGVNVCCGDMTGNGMADILTGAGPGPIFGPHVRGFAVDGTPLSGLSFLSYGTNKWGVNVAAGDIDSDGFEEIITGAGPGAVFGPHVRGWNYDGTPGVEPIPGVSYFAYGTPKWGVNVSAGDIDGDGYDEIVTGAGPGAVYGPHVRGWNVDGGTATAIPGVSFFAYGTLKYGVNVTCGDVDGDGIDEIVTGAGPGDVFGPHVRGWDYDGSSVAPLPGLSFFAWPSDVVRFGVNVFAGADLNGDGRAELVVGCGPDPDADTEVKVYEYDGSGQTLWFSLAEAFPEMKYGAKVAAGSF